MYRKTLFSVLAALLGLTVALPLTAQDDEVIDRTPEDCVSLSRVSRTKVIDDNTILFYMRGRRIYRNILDRECPGLEREGRFTYRVQGLDQRLVGVEEKANLVRAILA